jgi:hypothetical protein
MTRSDWLIPRGAVAHQPVFVSSKKVPYGAGLPEADGPTTDTEMSAYAGRRGPDCAL